jgi:hypothetical protein
VSTINHFLWGVCATTFAVGGVFFARFWRQTADRFFLVFALGFACLSLNYIGLGAFEVADDSRHLVYFLRLVAFIFITGGIIDKNRRA